MANRVLPEITPDLILRAYAAGIFPMAESEDDPHLHWIEPKTRGIIPLDGLVLSRSLTKLVRAERYTIAIDHDFAGVLDGCAAPASGRERTWINATIRDLFGKLHRLGHAHSVECYEGDVLVGGLYGLALGGAFFGESMFHRARDASKVALVHLVALLRAGGFTLLDTQFVTPHLASLGAVEITRHAYRKRLDVALQTPAAFADAPMSGQQALALLE